jgi:hypothetical protein
MTTTSIAPATAGTAADWDLAERVSLHMQEHFPDTEAAASWTVARDERDNTAVVVAQPGYDHTMPGGARAIHLYRWHCSLREAGFLAEGRTDMEVFGRPDEQSPDGRARWIHVTGWAAPTVPEPMWISRGFRDHHVKLRPSDHPPMNDVMRAGIRPDLAVFTYREDGKYGGMTVVVYTDEIGHPVAVNKVPAWLWAIGEAHRDHAEERSWCYLDDETREA